MMKIAGKVTTFTIDIQPMGATRMTRTGKYMKASVSPQYKAIQRYLSYKKFIGCEILRQREEGTLTGPLEVNLTFTMPILASWSGKKQRESVGKPHNKKPDIDNLIKGIFDAANKVAWEDDNQVYKVTAVKVYGEKPGFKMEVVEHG